VTVVALVLIRRGDSVLLVHQTRSGYWSLPGGKMERGESLDQAAIRETREETGLDVRLGRVVGLYSQPEAEELIFTFEAEVIGGAWHLGTDEIAASAYFPMVHLPASVRT
jgi:ADP-ribose pyrophosphatase YjhB (NUDIX family)